MGENHAYVCCHKGQGLAVISLDDYSISNWVSVESTPWQVELSPGEDTAYIGCGNFYTSLLVAVDLNTNQVIYQQSVPSFHHYGWGGGLGRTMYYMVKFKLSPKGDQFIGGGYNGWPGIFDAHTGVLIDSLTFGGWRGAAYSPTGDTLYVYSNLQDTVKMYRMNTADLSVIDSIRVTAGCWADLVSHSDLAINHDGSRILVNDWYDSRYCLFDFNTGTCQIIPEDMLF
jgi:DNA-binding beta-propeller fold protein YncE